MVGWLVGLVDWLVGGVGLSFVMPSFAIHGVTQKVSRVFVHETAQTIPGRQQRRQTRWIRPCDNFNACSAFLCVRFLMVSARATVRNQGAAQLSLSRLKLRCAFAIGSRVSHGASSEHAQVCFRGGRCSGYSRAPRHSQPIEDVVLCSRVLRCRFVFVRIPEQTGPN